MSVREKMKQPARQRGLLGKTEQTHGPDSHNVDRSDVLCLIHT